MSARRYDTALRWFVQSRSRPMVEHLVDLEDYNGVGSCQCENFRFVLKKLAQEMTKRRLAPTDDARCFHIKEARAALADLLITAKAQERRRKKAA